MTWSRSRSRVVLAAAVLATLAAVAGCGAEAPRPRPPAPPAAPDLPRDAGADAAADGGPNDPVPSVARIAAGGATLAPGMHEAARFEEEAPFARALVHAADKDTCARLAFAAAEPVSVALVDGTGATLELSPRAASGVTGTVCVPRGGELVVRVARAADAGAGVRVRGVAFAAP